jgi:hypothetical protein
MECRWLHEGGWTLSSGASGHARKRRAAPRRHRRQSSRRLHAIPSSSLTKAWSRPPTVSAPLRCTYASGGGSGPVLGADYTLHSTNLPPRHGRGSGGQDRCLADHLSCREFGDVLHRQRRAGRTPFSHSRQGSPLVADTEGAGRTIGAPSGFCEYGPLGNCTLEVAYVADGFTNHAKGTRGGLHGAKNRNFLRAAGGS